MTRDEVLELIRDHLADELELDPARIQESTHFRDDLSADSLDLYTLVQELEDTYGVKMSDEEAARIHTVRRGGRLRPGPRPVGALSAAQAPRPARAAAGRSRPAGGHALVLDGAALGFLRAARLPGRLRARPRGHHAPLSAPAARRLRRRPADEDPRAGGLRPLVPGRRGAAGDPRAPAQRRAADVAGPATEQLARTERVLASVIEAVIGAVYLEFGYLETADAVVEAFTPEIEQALAHPGGLQVGAAGAPGAARDGRDVRDRRRGGPAARADLRGRRDGRGRAARPRLRPLEEGRRAGRRRGGAGVLDAPRCT